MDIQILVAAHKPYDSSKYPDCYKPIQVGHNDKKEDLGYLKDSTGENIAEKNSQYCELTGLYWGWKNLNCDISGLCHYRRYFVRSNKSFKDVYNLILNQEDIMKIMKKKKIIMPVITHRILSNPKLYKNKPDEEQDYHLFALQELIQKTCPEYLPSWEKYTYGNKVSWGNMFIASKEDYDRYCEWVFPIMFTLEEEFEQKDKLIPRLMGFLSEILLCVWVDHNFSKKEIAYYPVVNTEIKEKKSGLKKLMRIFGIYQLVESIKWHRIYKKNNY